MSEFEINGVLVALLMISEALSLQEKYKANGIIQFFLNLIRLLAGRVKK